MTPLSTLIIGAIRYSHHRSLAPYRETIEGVRLLWPQLDDAERRLVLHILTTQTVPELSADAERWGDRTIPVSRSEAMTEARAWARLADDLARL